MGGCRFRYEELPAHVRAQVDAMTRRGEAASRRESGRGRRMPNKTEAAYRREVLDRRGDLSAVMYEGLSFRMGNGHRYTPDWVVFGVGGVIECHEVKGAYRFGSHGRARLAFDQAKAEFPGFRWVWATWAKGSWRVET